MTVTPDELTAAPVAKERRAKASASNAAPQSAREKDQLAQVPLLVCSTARAEQLDPPRTGPASRLALHQMQHDWPAAAAHGQKQGERKDSISINQCEVRGATVRGAQVRRPRCDGRGATGDGDGRGATGDVRSATCDVASYDS